MGTAILTAMLCIPAARQASAETMVTPGRPLSPGQESFEWNDGGGWRTLEFPSGNTQEEKTTNLLRSLEAEGVSVHRRNGSLVLPNATGARLGNKTQESNRVSRIGFDGNPLACFGSVSTFLADGSTGLTGRDARGLPSTYDIGFEASMGGAAIALSANLDYTQLWSPTLDSLLTQQYAALHMQLYSQAPEWIGALEYDRANGVIRFQLESDSWDSFLVHGGSTDNGLWNLVSLHTGVPEIDPAGCSSVAAFALGFLGYLERKGRRCATPARGLSG